VVILFENSNDHGVKTVAICLHSVHKNMCTWHVTLFPEETAHNHLL